MGAEENKTGGKKGGGLHRGVNLDRKKTKEKGGHSIKTKNCGERPSPNRGANSIPRTIKGYYLKGNMVGPWQDCEEEGIIVGKLKNGGNDMV